MQSLYFLAILLSQAQALTEDSDNEEYDDGWFQWYEEALLAGRIRYPGQLGRQILDGAFPEGSVSASPTQPPYPPGPQLVTNPFGGVLQQGGGVGSASTPSYHPMPQLVTNGLRGESEQQQGSSHPLPPPYPPPRPVQYSDSEPPSRSPPVPVESVPQPLQVIPFASGPTHAISYVIDILKCFGHITVAEYASQFGIPLENAPWGRWMWQGMHDKLDRYRYNYRRHGYRIARGFFLCPYIFSKANARQPPSPADHIWYPAFFIVAPSGKLIIMACLATLIIDRKPWSVHPSRVWLIAVNEGIMNPHNGGIRSLRD